MNPLTFLSQPTIQLFFGLKILQIQLLCFSSLEHKTKSLSKLFFTIITQCGDICCL